MNTKLDPKVKDAALHFIPKILCITFKYYALWVCAGGDAAATQKWLDTAGGQRTKPQNVWTQQKPDQPSQWAKGSLTDRDRGVQNAWAKQSQQ